MIECEICKRQFEQITNSHLKKSHKITLIEYKVQFPEAIIVSQNTSKKISNKIKGRERSNDHKQNLSNSIQQGFKNGRQPNRGMLGKKDSKETLERKRVARTGKKHSAKTKDKIGAKHKGKKVPRESVEKQKSSMKIAIANNGGKGFGVGPRSLKFKRRMSEVAKARPIEEKRRRAKLATEGARGRITTPESRERYRCARLKYMKENPEKLPKRMFNTVPELEFEQEIIKLGISYIKQYHSSKPHHLYDFNLENKILIEIDGPYHRDLAVHGGNQEHLNKIIYKDSLKNMAAGKFGMRIYRIPVGQHLPNNWKEILIEQGFDIEKEMVH
jgi:hypothetical protein